jgi:isoleucyl-tRNA synthetase
MLPQRPWSLPLALARRPVTFQPFSLSAVSLSSPTSSSPKKPKAKGKKAKDPLQHFYSESLNLPKTAFPLRAQATKREGLFWQRTTDRLYDWQVRCSLSIFLTRAKLMRPYFRRSKKTDRFGCFMMDRLMRTGICIAVRPLPLSSAVGLTPVRTGHALNKITKDLINRSKLIQGYRVQSVSLCSFLPLSGLKLTFPASSATLPATTPTVFLSN